MTGSSDSGYSISLQGGRVIYLSTFLKSLLPSLRISYMSTALRKQTVPSTQPMDPCGFFKKRRKAKTYEQNERLVPEKTRCLD